MRQFAQLCFVIVFSWLVQVLFGVFRALPVIIY